jgi:hypothetical protein
MIRHQGDDGTRNLAGQVIVPARFSPSALSLLGKPPTGGDDPQNRSGHAHKTFDREAIAGSFLQA